MAEPSRAAYDWHILEEPPYTEECWAQVSAARQDSAMRPIDQACQYPDFPIDKLVHTGLLKKAPDLVEMLRVMNVGLEPLNETLAWASVNGQQNDWEQAALTCAQHSSV